MVLKSDQDASITDVLNNITSKRAAASRLEKHEAPGVQTGAPRNIHEKSPVSSSAANGFIERGVHYIEGQARTLKLALESRIREMIRSDHNIAPWIIEYAGAPE